MAMMTLFILCVVTPEYLLLVMIDGMMNCGRSFELMVPKRCCRQTSASMAWHGNEGTVKRAEVAFGLQNHSGTHTIVMVIHTYSAPTYIQWRFCSLRVFNVCVRLN